MALYDYTSTNTQLIKDLALEHHIEGDGQTRPIATTIYYLLTADDPRGFIHRNKSHTMHVHHQGRSEYTLISARPQGAGEDWVPNVTTRVMGPYPAQGETRQLFVEGGVWKMSRIPEADLAFATSGDGEKVGCLISEVVAPGFVWDDHEWMTMDVLRDLFKNAPDAEAQIKRYSVYINPEVKVV
ncbi:hypothetical protein FRB99_005275 [Tulasnella sp. 403]|nr:hypothetical protein FRB99_005275 [Tulasnella sp. 403]